MEKNTTTYNCPKLLLEHTKPSAAMIKLTVLLITILQCLHGYGQWIQQGPAPIFSGQSEIAPNNEVVGAVNCVTPHPTDANILYIGAVNGGVWRTANALAASPNWVFISGEFTSQAIGALEFDPTDASRLTLVAANGRTSSFSNFGTGNRSIYRTTTGTAPWTNIATTGTFNTINITGIAARGATVVAATNAGLQRTINTGGTWTAVSGAAGSGLPAGQNFDLVSDLADNAVLYTNAGTTGIYRSNNTGETWTKVSNAAVDADLAGAGNLEMAVGNANNLYLAIVRGTRLAALYRSPDGGTTWTALDIPATVEAVATHGIHPGGQGNRHLSLAASPTNANIVYIGGDRQPWRIEPNNPLTGADQFPNSLGAGTFSGRLFRVNASLAAGTQSASITHSGTAGNTSPHADSRDMDFDANGNLIEGDDGGVYRQSNPTNTTGNWISVNGNLNITEHHSADWDAVSKIIMAGAQDNGSQRQQTTSNLQWSNFNQGDGGDITVNDFTSTTSSVRYFSAQRLQNFRRAVYNTSNTETSRTTPTLTDIATGVRVANGMPFVTPIKINSQNGNRILIATTGALFESADQANTLSNIGAFTVNNDGADALAYGAVDNADIIYAGVANTVRIRTAAAPAAFTTSAAYTGGNVLGITINPDDSRQAYVIDATRVFQTTTTGTAWGNITGTLTGLNPGTLRSVVYIPNSDDDILAVGTDNGVYIAPGPAFNTWVRLGTELINVAVMDLEYKQADQMLVAGTMGRGTWSFKFTDRSPVDVALVLDLSGSMASPACATCATKLQVLKDAVEIFVQLWKTLAIDDDRLGTIYFKTNIASFQVGGNVMLPVLANADNMVADARAQTSGQLTAVGGGLQLAINSLTDDTRPRNIILFTDGMQNVDPGIDFTTMAIRNDLYGPNSNVSPTTPPTILNSALGIKINTVGVGATSAFETQLAQIASSTGGITKITTAPDDDLRQFFVEELVDVLRNFSPQLVDYRTINGTSASENFEINETAKEILFKVSYPRGNQPSISIFKGKNDVTKLARITTGQFYSIFSFPFEKLLLIRSMPSEGSWRVQVKNAQQVPFQIAAITDEAKLEYKISSGNKIYKAGEPLNLSTEVLVDKQLVFENTTVTASIKGPSVNMANLLVSAKQPVSTTSDATIEPDLSAGELRVALLNQDPEFKKKTKPMAMGNVALIPGSDRVFKSNFTATTTPGNYTITYTIKGNNTLTGPFERIEQQSAVVRFSNFDYKTSLVKVKKKQGEKSGKTLWTWTFTPKDKYGNYLGPDFSDRLQAKVEDGELKSIKDLGNGTYVLEIGAKNKVSPKLTIGFYDETWYSGTVKPTGCCSHFCKKK